MVLIKARAFVHTFQDLWRFSDRRLCFILGTGTSSTSGVRTKDELARLWLDDIASRMSDEQEAFNDFVAIHDIDLGNPATAYTEIYNERFRYDVALGVEYISTEVADARPAYGYAVLAQILAARKHTVVITSNVDSLVEEALYTYTNRRPLICDGATMAGFAKPSVNRPLIIRIADALRKGLAKPEKLSMLTANLTPVLANSIPVIIGYDGPDGERLMDCLQGMPGLDNMFWCRQSGSGLADRVGRFIEKHNGKLVEIEGFDELMLMLQDALNLPLLTDDIKGLAEHRASEYDKQIQTLRAQQVPRTVEVQSHIVKTRKAALQKVVDEQIENDTEDEVPATPDVWTVWEARAKAARTSDERDAIYSKALEELPKSSELHINYAIFLQDSRKDYDAAEQHYKQVLALSPGNANYNGSYAAFLYNIRKNYDEAEKYYKKALSLDPGNASVNANYGLFLKNVSKDYTAAEKYYKTALEIDPDNAIYAVNYALFLKEVHRDYEAAEQYFKKAIQLDPENANSYGNYALFLKDVRKEYDEAEAYLKKAMDKKPNSASYIGNYAGFLHYVRKDYEAAAVYYRKALQLDPGNPINTGNYANLLKHITKEGNMSENIFKTSFDLGPLSGNYKGNYSQLLRNIAKDYVGAEKHYRMALELDPGNAINHSNYATFLKNITKEYDKAEKHYKKALEIAPDNADYNCNYAIFLKDVRQDYYGAQRHYKRSLELDPDNPNNNGNYAGFLFAIGRDKQAWTYLDTALRNCTDDALAAELYFYQYAHLPVEREAAYQLLKALLGKGVRSMGFNLQPNVEGAKQDGHPDHDKLQLLADILTKDAPLGKL